MILELFLKSDGARNSAANAMQLLRSVNFFSVLMDLCFDRTTRQRDDSTADDAYRAAFRDGYRACAEDVCYFDERFDVYQPGKVSVRPDYGALDKLLADGTITEEEHGKLKRERNR